MKQTLLACCILILVSCTKLTTNTTPPPTNNTSKVELSSIDNNLVATGISIKNQWHVTNAVIDKTISNDSSKAVLIIDSSNLHLQYVIVSSNNNNNTPITQYDTTINIGSKKVYSIITVSKQIATHSFANKPLVLQENDFAAPVTGFAKLRFIIAVPTVGQGEYNKIPEQMIPRVNLKSSSYQIDLASQGRYYLDNLTNPSVLQFASIPAGTYTQTAVMQSIPGLTYTFESGKKYTILITRMARTQYPENDNLKVIEHSF
jgi:hypothetical protein